MKAMLRILPFCLIFLLTTGVVKANGEYKTYQRKSDNVLLFDIRVSEDNWIVTFYADDSNDVFDYVTEDVNIRNDGIHLADEMTLNADEIKAPGWTIDPDDIVEVRVDHDEESQETLIEFYRLADGAKKVKLRKTRDRISYWNAIIIEHGEFIRGSVVALSGNVEVYGEVNGDVVAVFGDIKIGKDAVVRGDVIAVNGDVKLDAESSVFGLVSSSGGGSSTRRNRARRWKDIRGEIEVAGSLAYDRVDGLSFMLGPSYNDPDSLIPSFEALGGRGLESGRWRYKVSLEQTVLRGRFPLQVGGQVYRLLKSDDDGRIIFTPENTAFAFFVKEDWQDYYEAEGAYGFVRLGFLRWNKLEVGYLSETQNWLDAHPRLWGLFNGKDFRANFSSVPYSMRMASMATDFSDQQVTSLVTRLTIDSRDEEDSPERGWYGFAAYEYSPERWKGDFDFERFEVKIKRYQPLSRYLSVHIVGAYGRVTGDGIPLNRRFYLGGFGTVYGYKHKEYMGDEYMLLGGEYRFRIPRSRIIPFLRYDGGKIGTDRISGENSWLSSISVGMELNDNLRLFLSRGLDDSNRDPIFYARFSVNPF